jgi:hypothetical protein
MDVIACVIACGWPSNAHGRAWRRRASGVKLPARRMQVLTTTPSPLASPQVNEARALRDKLNKTLKKALKQREAEAEAARAAEATAKEKARVLSAFDWILSEFECIRVHLSAGGGQNKGTPAHKRSTRRASACQEREQRRSPRRVAHPLPPFPHRRASRSSKQRWRRGKPKRQAALDCD